MMNSEVFFNNIYLRDVAVIFFVFLLLSVNSRFVECEYFCIISKRLDCLKNDHCWKSITDSCLINAPASSDDIMLLCPRLAGIKAAAAALVHGSCPLLSSEYYVVGVVF